MNDTKEILERLRKKRILEEEKKYVKESIRLDREDYRELLDEERTLHKELGSLRKRVEENGSDEFLGGDRGHPSGNIRERRYPGASTGEYS